MRYSWGLLIGLLAFNVHSGVNLKNGNFFISYTDIIIPSAGKTLEITRTYNSKSTEIGWFGFGWGSEFETNPRVSADGSVIIQENGAGALTRFDPKKKVDARAAAKKIVAVVKKKTALSGANAKKLIDKLARDAELRYSYAKQFGVEAKIANGAKFHSNQRGLQELIKKKDGFVRKSADGTQEFFNRHGRLAQIKYKSGHIINLTPSNRENDKELKSIKDSLGKQIFLKWYPDGRVKEIDASGNRKASYTYDGKTLASSVDLAGNKYQYKHDSNHNLTNIKYGDGTETKVTYERNTQLVSSVTKKNGEKTSYKHGSNPKNPDLHYWTEVTKTRPGQKSKPVTNRYEYEIRIKPDGQQYNHRIVTVVNGQRTETVYSPNGGQPLKIVKGKRVTSFEYDKDGLLTKKTLPNGKTTALEYHKRCKKVSKVVEGTNWTKFDYGKKCNLKKAVNSKGKTVFLVYDRKSRITKMVDQNKKTKEKKVLNFVYNAMSKPVEIKIDKVGKINVQYDNYGGIKKVESKQGQEIALKVTRAFQNLLTIVRPAGVSLSAN